eukprot:COSAG01_NODE_1349_length_10618_cov_12.745318_8_plen_102_part_00
MRPVAGQMTLTPWLLLALPDASLGDNLKVKLGSVEDWEQIESGFMMCPVKHPMPFTTVFDVQVCCVLPYATPLDRVHLVRTCGCTCQQRPVKLTPRHLRRS